MSQRRVVVVKVGSNTLLREGRLDIAFLEQMAAQLARVATVGWRPILVSSGAVASGRAWLHLREDRSAALPDRQALAAIGQADLVHRWQVALSAHGLVGAQLLLTADDFHDRLRYLNLSATLRSLFAFDVVPIINENDTVAVDELTLGDNDRLSALVAAQLDASRLLLLTDIDGVYDADPRRHPEARLQRELAAVTREQIAAAGEAGAVGRGGMRSKLQAAAMATAAGVQVHIAHGRAERVVERLLDDEPIGTVVRAADGAAASSRQRWLAHARMVKGRLHLDDGAVQAVTAAGRSLLLAGIRHCDGEFERGDTVALCDAAGHEVARGLAGLSSAEIARVAGLRMDVAARELGYALPKAAVHRDNLLVL